MSDAIDYARSLEDRQTELGAEKAKHSLHSVREHRIVWIDKSGEQRDERFTGTPAERIVYLSKKGIDKRPYAFRNLSALKADVGGNDAGLKQMLSKS